MSLDCIARRQVFLGLSGAALVSLLPKTAYASRSTVGVKQLRFYNRHTGEHSQGNFWQDGHYQAETINEFNHLLRDFRQDITMPMDKRLFEYLFKLQNTLQVDKEIHVISGYRSPKTNNMLAAKSHGVAKHSYHMKGMAIDIAIPGIETKDLRDAALSLKLGGVGFYPRSGFVHIDCGPVRSWG
ncbi:DUF882 domain-containing protein [Shewanella intestini]|uniref:Murein endopeptidase K n=1 Tax=Shewanella intestini TaxID=2017544 RepID=A0ABS5HYT1_9GAMM|nr:MULTISPECIES: DUF882 domain-containing protein [Shewanella]MBR9726943.1 DUF882 domain-containing protein [Shewanella intestini]MRG34491.1 DUF882 domain-containing protein [Shewanella sp. XMDDZSB0408]